MPIPTYSRSWRVADTEDGEKVFVEVFADGVLVRSFPFDMRALDTPEKADAMALRLAKDVRNAAGHSPESVPSADALRDAAPDAPMPL